MTYLAKQCCSCGENVYRLPDSLKRPWLMRFQHGENPEAVMEVDVMDAPPVARVGYDVWIQSRITHWTNHIHTSEAEGAFV
jgi:hypothetical protein